jgi:hypothetical protein
MNEELKSLLAIYENKLIHAWVYDTELGFKDYPSGLQTSRAREKFTLADEAKANLIAKIEELTCV